MNQKIMQRLTLYDPLQLDEESFKHSFIARQKELERLLKRIKDASDNSNTHALHTLIYAHRGMGKTSLLRRIAIAVGEDKELSQQWIPLNFREEQYNLTSLNQLWKNCADPLAGWCEDNGDTETAYRLDDLVDSHSNCDFLAEIKAICNKHQRRLLLLIDNLNLILDNLPAQEQWQLRGELQGNHMPLLIACSASMPEQLSNEQSAFFEFFRIQQLQPLSELELTDCLKRIAQHRGEPGKEALKDIEARPERIKALHRLCGGNPRTLMIIYQALETLSTMTQAQTFQDLLNEVLENVTALYKARTEELAPQQRQIVDAIALHWDPVSLAQLAEITGLKNTSLSAQIKRLIKNGIVEKSATYQGKSLYQLAERFYNIWYLMRNGSRRHKRKLIWFSRFFTTYYSQAEVIAKVRQQRDQHFFCNELTIPLIESIADNSVKNALLKQISLQVLETLDTNNLPKHLTQTVDADALNFVQLKRKLENTIADVLDDPHAISKFVELVCGSISLNIEEKMRIANTELSLFQINELIKVFTDEANKMTRNIGKETFTIFSSALRQGVIVDSEDIKGILAYSVETEPRLLGVVLQHFWQTVKEKLLADQTLCQAFQHALTQPTIEKTLTSRMWFNIGYLYHEHLKDYTLAKEAYLKAIELDENQAIPWHNLGNLYQYSLKDYSLAKAAYLKSIELDEKYANPWYNLGNLYQNHLKAYTLAKEAYLKAIELDKNDAYPWNGLGNLYQDHFKNYALAKDAYKRAIELDNHYEYPKANLVWLGIMSDDNQLITQYLPDLTVAPVGKQLINCALAIQKNNIGDALEQLKTILDDNNPTLWIECRDDLLRLVTLFYQRGFHAHVLNFLYQHRFHLILAPFVIALEAIDKGENHLKTINPEMRPEAESLYHYLNSLLAVNDI